MMGLLRQLPGISIFPAVFFMATCIWAVPNGWSSPLGDFVQAAAGRHNETKGKAAFEMSNLDHQLPLTLGFRDAFFPSYAEKAADTSLPEPARAFLFKVMAGRAAKLNQTNRNALTGLMLQTMEQGASPTLKAQVLAELGRLPDVDPVVFTSRLKASDTDLKAAAHTGLARKVRMNRRKGLTEANRAVFSALKALYDSDPDPDLFRSLAMMSEDFSRN